ncbi:MAG TPA: HAD-IG family 5'-nucleotidase [Polyangiales bacterium]|nr:HAD-IG family 5'-nucleotidase [Polyangiales bacterium]
MRTGLETPPSDSPRLPSSDPLQLSLPSEITLPADLQPPRTRRIYCNRNMKLDHIQMIGFDMDYTLALYKQEELDRLSIEATAKKLVERGYPTSLLGMSYRTNFPIRGLLVDKQLGNVLKTDRYRYVKKAFHGTRELTSEERRQTYQSRPVRPDPRRFHSIDSLFALSEVTVFSAVVDELDRPFSHVDYGQLFDDVRACIDEAHRDGSIKETIMADIERYIERDPNLGATLHMLRSAGKRLFLLTNSEPAYTDAVMSHMLRGEHSEYRSWRSYFDMVITSAMKPAFFMRDAPFEEVEEEGPHWQAHKSRELQRGRVYLGGSQAEFERLTGVPGDRVLYVGDHIYGDVLRAKKQSAWRTLMIIQELSDELSAMEKLGPEIARADQLEARLTALHDALHERIGMQRQLTKLLTAKDLPAERRVELAAGRLRLKRSIERIRLQIKTTESEHIVLERAIEHAFHPFWGSALKAESEPSSFGEQVERYACLYTDRVTNLLGYTAGHYFRGPRHRMAHEP